MNKILILHPEGNLNGNPNLYGLIKIMGENGWNIEIISKKVRGGYQDININKVKFSLVDNFNRNHIDKHLLTKRLFSASWKEKPDVIIGVDEGIIEAAYYANKFSIPLGLISYEIKYVNELGGRLKKKEINASSNISFVIVQDKIRERELLRENRISDVRTFLIPVAGARSDFCEKNNYIHEKYDVDSHKKVVLSIGSIADWSCSGELIKSVKYWPDDWILFIHNRNKDNDFIDNYVAANGALNKNIIISNECINNIEDMARIILASDIGAVFYRATYYDYSCGNNIKYVGMSSGKAATYLKYGLPVAVFGNSYYEEYVEKYNIGVKVADPSRFIPVTFDSEISSRCRNFFDHHLDLNITSIEFIKYLEQFKSKT